MLFTSTSPSPPSLPVSIKRVRVAKRARYVLVPTIAPASVERYRVATWHVPPPPLSSPPPPSRLNRTGSGLPNAHVACWRARRIFPFQSKRSRVATWRQQLPPAGEDVHGPLLAPVVLRLEDVLVEVGLVPSADRLHHGHVRVLGLGQRREVVGLGGGLRFKKKKSRKTWFFVKKKIARRFVKILKESLMKKKKTYGRKSQKSRKES